MSSQLLMKANERLASTKTALSKRIRSLDFTPSIYLSSSGANKKQRTTTTAATAGAPSAAVPSSSTATTKSAGAAYRAPPADFVPQRRTTAISTLSGKLYQIIDHLKRVDVALTAAEIKEQLRVDILADRQLYDLVVQNAKITFADGKYAYKPVYNVRSQQDLLTLVREHWMSGQGGVHVRDLQDGWKATGKFIEELVATKELIVLRHKDGKPLVVFHNDMPRVDTRPFEEFRDLWKQFTIPDDADMQRELSSAGLSLLQVQDDKPRAEDANKGRKKRRTRQIKITNTHLKDIDLSVDYPMKKRPV